MVTVVGPRTHPVLYPRDATPKAVPKYISGRTSYLRVRLAFHRYPQLIRAVFNRHRCGPPAAVRPPSPWPWVDHLVSGPLLLTRGLPPHALFGLGFPAAPALHQHVNLPANVTRRFILQKARRRTRTSLSCFDCLGTTGFRFCFTPLPRYFSPFPHGTGALSVARSS